MNNLPQKAATVARFGLPAGLVLAAVNYFQMQSAGEAVDITELAKYLAGPVLGGFAISSAASPLEKLKDWFGGRGGDTLGVLESLKVILEQFKAKGVPDSLSATVVWGSETYEFDWAKRQRKGDE